MKIKIRDIPEQGLILDFSIPAAHVKGRDYWSLASDMVVSGKVYRSSMTVLIGITCRADKRILCARCLDDPILPFELSFERNIKFANMEDEIDLDEVIFQEIELNIPIKELCKEDCRGLCPVCGADLNKGECGCKRAEIKEE